MRIRTWFLAVISIAVLFSPCATLAADWIAAHDSSRVKIWVDRASIRKEGQVSTAWVRIWTSFPIQLPDGIPYQASVNLFRINCANNTAASEYMAVYDPSFARPLIHPKTNRPIAGSTGPLDYEPVIPGTFTEPVRDFLCYQQ